MQALKVHSQIPYQVEQAFRERLDIASFTTNIVTSSKGANSEDVSVNEAGSSSYSVMGDPVGFLKITISSTDYYIPYFNA